MTEELRIRRAKADAMREILNTLNHKTQQAQSLELGFYVETGMVILLTSEAPELRTVTGYAKKGVGGQGFDVLFKATNSGLDRLHYTVNFDLRYQYQALSEEQKKVLLTQLEGYRQFFLNYFQLHRSIYELKYSLPGVMSR